MIIKLPDQFTLPCTLSVLRLRNMWCMFLRYLMKPMIIRKPSSFSRALRLDLGAYKVLVISGTASVNEEGKAEHIGDFKAQLWRTYRNITNLLEAEGMTWHDVVRTTNYLRDIERDYAEFNKIRSSFFKWLNLDPLPASTGIQARLCWETLLVEIEAYAICKSI